MPSGIGILDWPDALFRHLKTLYKGEEGYTLQVFFADGEEGYTLHIHTADGVVWIHPAIHTAGSERG